MPFEDHAEVFSSGLPNLDTKTSQHSRLHAISLLRSPKSEPVMMKAKGHGRISELGKSSGGAREHPHLIYSPPPNPHHHHLGLINSLNQFPGQIYRNMVNIKSRTYTKYYNKNRAINQKGNKSRHELCFSGNIYHSLVAASLLRQNPEHPPEVRVTLGQRAFTDLQMRIRVWEYLQGCP